MTAFSTDISCLTAFLSIQLSYPKLPEVIEKFNFKILIDLEATFSMPNTEGVLLYYDNVFFSKPINYKTGLVEKVNPKHWVLT